MGSFRYTTNTGSDRWFFQNFRPGNVNNSFLIDPSSMTSLPVVWRDSEPTAKVNSWSRFQIISKPM